MRPAIAMRRILTALGAALTLVRPVLGAPETLTISDLAERTHFHGLAVDPADSSRLLLATHHGLYSVERNGSARLISSATDDFMGFLPHPTDGVTLYSSGHPASGGNLGFMTSTDGGRTWVQLSPGASGIADFHNMAISPVDPKTIYGTYDGLQVSRDGGKSWELAGPEPEGLLDLAASAGDPNRLFAGTKFGLLRSDDGGKSWRPALDTDDPVPLVAVGSDGTLFAFAVGTGLLRAAETELVWQMVGEGLNDLILVHLAIDANQPDHLFAVAFDVQSRKPSIVASMDRGETWSGLVKGVEQ